MALLTAACRRYFRHHDIDDDNDDYDDEDIDNDYYDDYDYGDNYDDGVVPIALCYMSSPY